MVAIFKAVAQTNLLPTVGILAPVLAAARFWVYRSRSRHDCPALLATDILTVLSIVSMNAATGMSFYCYLRVLEWERTADSHDILTHPWVADRHVIRVYFWRNVIGLLGIWFVKGAWCSVFFEIFPRVILQGKLASRVMYGFSAYTCAAFVVTAVLEFMPSGPLSLTLNTGSKHPTQPIPLMQLVFFLGLTVDVGTIIVPFVMLRKLTRALRKSLKPIHIAAATMLMAFGLLAIAANCVRQAIMLHPPKDPLDLEGIVHEMYAIDTYSLTSIWAIYFAFLLLPLRAYLRNLSALGTAISRRFGSRRQQVVPRSRSRPSPMPSRCDMGNSKVALKRAIELSSPWDSGVPSDELEFSSSDRQTAGSRNIEV